MALIDEDMQIQIQSFTSWAQSKGYHVVGALIGPKGDPRVRIFATAPIDVEVANQKSHVEKLLKIVNQAMNGRSEGAVSLPLIAN